MALAGLLGACLLSLGCTTGDGHPLRPDAPRLPEAGRGATGRHTLEEAPLTVAAGRALVVGDLGRLEAALRALPVPTRRGVPRVHRLERVEAAVKRRLRLAGHRDVRHVIVVGTVARLRATPDALLQRLLDPQVERWSLDADAVQPLPGQFDLPGHRRDRWWIDKRRVGWGPFRVDLRFALHVERRSLPDGSVVLRFDLARHPNPESVSLYRGLAFLEPQADGTTVAREIVAFGTGLSVPGPLAGTLRDLVFDTFETRALRLFRRKPR